MKAVDRALERCIQNATVPGGIDRHKLRVNLNSLAARLRAGGLMLRDKFGAEAQAVAEEAAAAVDDWVKELR